MHFMIEASCITSFIISKCCKTMNKTNHNIKKEKGKKGYYYKKRKQCPIDSKKYQTICDQIVGGKVNLGNRLTLWDTWYTSIPIISQNNLKTYAMMIPTICNYKLISCQHYVKYNTTIFVTEIN